MFSRVSRGVVALWLHDTPPLCGAARAAFYASLLAAAAASPASRPPLGDSPLHAPPLWRVTPPELRAVDSGLLGATRAVLGYPRRCGGKGRRASTAGAGRLRALSALTLAAWLCCIVGLGGRAPAVLVAVGFGTLSLFSASCIGVSHRWLLPVLALCALSLADGNDEFSLDAVLASKDYFGAKYPFPPGGAPALTRTGLATKLVQLLACHTLFSGGVSKLLNGGLRWCDGTSLAFYMRNTDAGAVPSLKRFLASSPLELRLMAAGSVVFELAAAAPVVLPGREALKSSFVASCVLFHLAIWMTMNPNYLPQTLAYFLTLAPPRAWVSSSSPPAAAPPLAVPGDAAAAAVCCVLAFSLLCVAAFRIEWWPISSIPMYSFYRGGGFSRGPLPSASHLQALVAEAAAAKYPYALGWSGEWARITLTRAALIDDNNNDGDADGATQAPAPAGVGLATRPRAAAASRRAAAAARGEEGERAAALAAASPPLELDVISTLSSSGGICARKALLRAVHKAVIDEMLFRAEQSDSSSPQKNTHGAGAPVSGGGGGGSPAARLLRDVVRPVLGRAAAAEKGAAGGGDVGSIIKGRLVFCVPFAGGGELVLAVDDGEE